MSGEQKEATPIVEKAARATDDEVTKYAANRMLRTGGGLLITAAGLAFAFMRPDMAVGPVPIGFIVALVGAGIIEPTTIISVFRPKP